MTDCLREIRIPDGTTGILFLHHMPARSTEEYVETMEEFRSRAEAAHIHTILCLCSQAELEQKSPEYAKAIADGTLGYAFNRFAIEDYGIPSDIPAYISFITEAADLLKAGKNCILHCGAGIGRTGMTASCILSALGLPAAQADSIVSSAQAGAETNEQRAFIEQVRIVIENS